jgi:hypothetical protein
MLQGLRIAIGRCECAKPYRSAVQAKACEAIDVRLQSWLTRLPADLAAVPGEAYEDVRVEGHFITFGTHKHALESGETSSSSKRWSTHGCGRRSCPSAATGSVQRAPDEVMWAFR